jgi:signal transduction histidine kinase
VAAARALLVLADEHGAAVVRRIVDAASLPLVLAVGLVAARRELARATPPVILAEHPLADGDVRALLSADGPPVVALLPADNDAVARGLLRAGALDVVVKSATWPAELARELTRAHRAADHHAERRAAEAERPARAPRAPTAAGDASREQIEAQLLQAEKLESIGRLAGGVAHDLNNMLAPILGYADLLLLDLPPEAPQRDDLEQILDAARRCRDLVRQLLAFARRQPMELAPTDLNAVLSRAARMLRHATPATITIEAALAPGLGPLRADAGLLEHLLGLLATNAVEAMPTGGTLRLETAELVLDEEAAHALGELTAGTYTLLTVSDTGVGMAPATLAQAFEPFFTTKRFGQGAGLGLSTAYGIVRQHGGAIRVVSEAGAGTTLQIWLPCADTVAVGRTSTAKLAPVGGDAETILLVDDHAAVRAPIGRMLRQAGYQVLEAGSGALALALAAGHDGPIELVLADLFLGDLDGRRLLAELRRDRPRLRALFMSGYGRVTADTGAAGDLDLLEKPFSMHTLTRRLREALRDPLCGE